MRGIVQKRRFGIGLFIADVCLLVPSVFYTLLAHCGLVSCGSFDLSGFWIDVAIIVGVLFGVNVIIWRFCWLRFFVCAVLAVLTLIAIALSPEFIRSVVKLNSDSVIPCVILVAGLVLCPLAIYLLATAVRFKKAK